MRCDIGRLQAYSDDALAAEERAAVERHLLECDACQADLAVLQRQDEAATTWLTALDPESHEIPDATEALARFRAAAQPAQTTMWTTVKERFEKMKQTLLTSRWRPAVIGLVALVAVVGLFSFAPARQVAAQFLGIFRVRKFAVIPVDPAQVERLESLEDMVDSGMLGEPTYLREPGEQQVVADAAEASAVAGFDVREPATIPGELSLRKFAVESGPAMRFEVDPAVAQLILGAAGVEGATLPFDETVPVEVDIPSVVLQEYALGTRRLSVSQMPSPTVTLPPGIDPSRLGELVLQFLGMPAEDAQRLAATIDWTSTFVVPMPTDVGQFREVEVGGVAGLLLEEQHPTRAGYRHRVVIWQRDGLVFAVEGTNLDAADLLLAANSLY